MQIAAAGAQPQSSSSCLQGLPSLDVQDYRYVVQFATTEQQVEEALKLRFEVFNLELGEGLESSFQTGRDRDEFDSTCHHLLVSDKTTGSTIGTYRLRTIEMAGNADGFYSAAEFDLTKLPHEILAQSVELGRACIAREHRNRQVLFLIWKGLASYLSEKRKRFTFGCCSLTTQEASDGIAAWQYLKSQGCLHNSLCLPVKPGYECEAPAQVVYPDIRIPKLFSTYLSVRAKVVSPPAIDRRFKTIDFLVLLDIEAMDPRMRSIFFG
jgi:putative hemolysin